MSDMVISTDFLTAFAALPQGAQGKTAEFLIRFYHNPGSARIRYEQIQGALDKKLCWTEIDGGYRAVVARQRAVYILLWVDRWNRAYDWAKYKKCEINPLTGTVQVYDLSPQPEGTGGGPFANCPRETLLRLGVPEAQLPFVQGLPSVASFYDSGDRLPADACENLEWLANGFSPDQVLAMLGEEVGEPAASDLAGALRTPASQRSFVVVEGEEELARIMAQPLEKWRVFLHPTQRRLVERDYSGPASVLGGAGTGKTVVAMHRAKWLASRLPEDKALLFTTFTANLAADIRSSLSKICTREELRRIEVVNLDAWVSQYLREQGYSSAIVYDKALTAVWEEAIALAGDGGGLPVQFYPEEWAKVAVSQGAFTKEAYLKASRVGRGTRLDRKRRLQVWRVFDEYWNILQDREIRDTDTAMYECRRLVERSGPLFPCVVVDEGQDLSSNAYRLLRALAGEEHPNDLFIVGDAHQRIYRNKTVLSRCGVNIRGRSSCLRINYRTTEETRRYAFSILKGIPFDNLDEDYDGGKVCQSLTHGAQPIVRRFKDAGSEGAYLAGEIQRLIQGGAEPRSICLVARTHSLLRDYMDQLTQAGIPVYEIVRSRSEDHSRGGVRAATMHRVKGLEFSYVFVAAANRRVIPLASAIDHTDALSEEESLRGEKCLLYVALTRARKQAYLTGSGAPSELLG